MSEDLNLVEQVKRLTERIETLEDVRALNTLRHNLPRYINDGRWDSVGELFSETAFLDYRHLGQAEGRAAIERYFAGLPQLIEDNSPAAQVLVKQFLHGHDVEILGDRATGVSFFEEKVVFDTESSIVAGKFTDSYVHEGARWLFSRTTPDSNHTLLAQPMNRCIVGGTNIGVANKRNAMSTNTPVADRIEIADLFTRFARLLDEQRWEDADTIFTGDVEIHSPRIDVRGIDKVVGFMRQSAVEGEHTQHTTTDLLVNVDGDQAAASANSLVYFYRDGRPPHQTSGLRLACTAVRTPAGWRLREARVMLAWMRKD
ncbi:nuclear transport factor 2 family protein [Nocardia gipuzkoensis]